MPTEEVNANSRPHCSLRIVTVHYESLKRDLQISETGPILLFIEPPQTQKNSKSRSRRMILRKNEGQIGLSF